MKNAAWAAGCILAAGLFACNTQRKAEAIDEPSLPQKTRIMKNLVSIIEIPVSDFSRATTFYQDVLEVRLQEVEMDGVIMGILPSEEGTVNVVLAKGEDYKPTTDGAVLYLQAGENLQPMLDRVKRHGGQILVPKTQISPEMGFFALFIDTEGNKLGLHSSK
jgi:uncharacterized protein